MLGWLAGNAAGALAAFVLDTGLTSQCAVRYGSGAGYWAAIHLHHKGYPYALGLDAVTFTRRAP